MIRWFCHAQALKKLENLKHLAINECIGVAKHTLEVVGRHCKNLKTLELSGDFPSAQTADMLYLIHLVNLEVLKITYNSKVSNDFLTDLVQHCQQLTTVDITGKLQLYVCLSFLQLCFTIIVFNRLFQCKRCRINSYRYVGKTRKINRQLYASRYWRWLEKHVWLKRIGVSRMSVQRSRHDNAHRVVAPITIVRSLRMYVYQGYYPRGC